jgi:hypothetical protein
MHVRATRQRLEVNASHTAARPRPYGLVLRSDRVVRPVIGFENASSAGRQANQSRTPPRCTIRR